MFEDSDAMKVRDSFSRPTWLVQQTRDGPAPWQVISEAHLDFRGFKASLFNLINNYLVPMVATRVFPLLQFPSFPLFFYFLQDSNYCIDINRFATIDSKFIDVVNLDERKSVNETNDT